jgi:hypothetical protein
MNFEIKSTFRYLKKTIFKRSKTYFAAGILTINVVICITLGTLYLQNHILPATIGSHPRANLWIALMKVAGSLMLASTILSLLTLLHHSFKRHLARGRLAASAAILRAVYIKLHLILPLLTGTPRRAYTPARLHASMPYAVYIRKHFNHDITT